jgi:hypothetical protein
MDKIESAPHFRSRKGCRVLPHSGSPCRPISGHLKVRRLIPQCDHWPLYRAFLGFLFLLFQSLCSDFFVSQKLKFSTINRPVPIDPPPLLFKPKTPQPPPRIPPPIKPHPPFAPTLLLLFPICCTSQCPPQRLLILSSLRLQ